MPSRPRPALALAAFALATAVAPALGALVGPRRPATRRWYRRLEKPPFTPPERAFGPVWSVLYPAIAVSGWRVWRAADGEARTRALALWGAQLALNAAWSPLFFRERRLRASLLDIGAMLGASTAYAVAAARVDRPAAALVVPYAGWLLLATAVNAEIAWRNA